MDFADILSKLNYWAVLTAAVSGFLVGGAWYSPALFAKRWMAANGFVQADLKHGNTSLIFGGSFTLSLISALVLAMFIGPSSNLSFGTTSGALVGLGWVATSFGITYFFERKPVILFLINAGYHIVTFTVMGAILGVWHN